MNDFLSDQLGINCPKQIDKLRNKAVIELREHLRGCTDGESRFSNLLLRLAPLRSLQPDVLEELFFAGLIGNVQIDSVVPYILKMETSEYQAQFGGQPSKEAAKDESADVKEAERDSPSPDERAKELRRESAEGERKENVEEKENNDEPSSSRESSKANEEEGGQEESVLPQEDAKETT